MTHIAEICLSVWCCSCNRMNKCSTRRFLAGQGHHSRTSDRRADRHPLTTCDGTRPNDHRPSSQIEGTPSTLVTWSIHLGVVLPRHGERLAERFQLCGRYRKFAQSLESKQSKMDEMKNKNKTNTHRQMMHKTNSKVESYQLRVLTMSQNDEDSCRLPTLTIQKLFDMIKVWELRRHIKETHYNSYLCMKQMISSDCYLNAQMATQTNLILKYQQK